MTRVHTIQLGRRSLTVESSSLGLQTWCQFFSLLISRSNAKSQAYADPESSQRVGQNGPLLLQDYHLIDLLAHFDRERIPERVVHAKGAGAYGEFEVTHDISDLVSWCEELGKHGH